MKHRDRLDGPGSAQESGPVERTGPQESILETV